jgi:hypothetical protein
VGLAASLCSDGRSRYRKYFPRLDSAKRLPPRSSFIGDSRRFSTFQNHTSPKRSNAVSEQHIRPFSCRERSSRWSASLVGLNGFNRPITASSLIAHRSTISLMIPSVVGSIQLNVRPVSLLPAFTAPEKAHIFFKMVATIDTKCMLYRGPTTVHYLGQYHQSLSFLLRALYANRPSRKSKSLVTKRIPSRRSSSSIL